MAAIQIPFRKTFRPNHFWLKISLYTWIASLGVLVYSVQAQSAITAKEYWNRVNNTQTLVSTLAGGQEVEALTALEEAALEWETISAVILPSNDVVPIDTSYLVALVPLVEPNLASRFNIVKKI